MKRITWIATALLLSMAAWLVAADSPHYVHAMKGVAGAQKATGQAIESGDMDAAKMHAAALEYHFRAMAGFWEGRGTADAVGISEDGIAGAEALAGALGAGDKDSAMEALGQVRGTCKACHSEHRTKDADGSWGFK